jgi:tRNA uridine 5-carbamoylmethylation protein Kti12
LWNFFFGVVYDPYLSAAEGIFLFCYYLGMNTSEVLILNGSPGSGKSTLANALAEKLREAGLAHAVIDVDELSRTYPEQDVSFQWDNLRSIWPRYATIPHLKAILPVLIDTEDDLKQLQQAVPAAKFMICELTASESKLKERVTLREPNEYWQNKLRGLIDAYSRRSDEQKFSNFQVSTDDISVSDTADSILRKAGWLQ